MISLKQLLKRDINEYSHSDNGLALIFEQQNFFLND